VVFSALVKPAVLLAALSEFSSVPHINFGLVTAPDPREAVCVSGESPEGWASSISAPLDALEVFDATAAAAGPRAYPMRCMTPVLRALQQAAETRVAVHSNGVLAVDVVFRSAIGSASVHYVVTPSA
jgi:hypothetical protein